MKTKAMKLFGYALALGLAVIAGFFGFILVGMLVSAITNSWEAVLVIGLMATAFTGGVTFDGFSEIFVEEDEQP